MNIVNQAALDICITESGGKYGCDITNVATGDTLVCINTKYATQAEALFYAISDKNTGLCDVNEVRQSSLCADGGQLFDMLSETWVNHCIFGEYASAHLLREVIVGLVYCRPVSIYTIASLDEKHFCLFNLILAYYKVNGETQILRKTAQEILNRFPELRKNIPGLNGLLMASAGSGKTALKTDLNQP